MENQYLAVFARMVWDMENPRPPIDRARRVVLGTLIGTVGTRSWTNMGRFYSNMVLTSPTYPGRWLRITIFFVVTSPYTAVYGHIRTTFFDQGSSFQILAFLSYQTRFSLIMILLEDEMVREKDSTDVHVLVYIWLFIIKSNTSYIHKRTKNEIENDITLESRVNKVNRG